MTRHEKRGSKLSLSSTPTSSCSWMRQGAGWAWTRLYARILGGARIVDTAPKRRKGKVSLIAAITSEGMNPNACLVHEDSVDSKAFLSYIEHVLCPTLEPGRIVIMDNFTIHHNSQVKELIEAQGCELLLPAHLLTPTSTP